MVAFVGGEFKNEHSCELKGVLSLQPLDMHTSAARLAMLSNHLPQAADLLGSTVRRFFSGTEREYARFTHMIKMPCNGTIFKIIKRFKSTLGADSIKENPCITVIYLDDDRPGQVGMFDLVTHHATHKQFGFKYVWTEATQLLTPGTPIAAGTIFAHAPSVTEQGDYKFGVEAQIALMGVPEGIEDGIKIRRGFLKQLAATGYGERTISWGKSAVAMNLHGTADVYKPFPEVGDYIRDDGLLFALREYDPIRAVVDMTPEALRHPTQFDKTVYATPSARVIDVQIIRGGMDNKSNLPSGTSEQCAKYYDKLQEYHQAIVQVHWAVKKRFGSNLILTPQLHTAIREAQGFLGPDKSMRVDGRIVRKYRNIPVDDWRVTIVYEYDIIPTIGYKLTGMSGDLDIL